MFIKKLLGKKKTSLLIEKINISKKTNTSYNHIDASYLAKLIMMNNRNKGEMSVPKIELTALEKNIVELIKLYVNSHNQQFSQDKIVCRIAGGWVRDKLLNIPSNDIDISIENTSISGEAFLNNLIDFYKEDDSRIAHYNAHVNQEYTLEEIFPKDIHKTKVNPDKSKHLETAIATIFDQSIDFVALRKEIYDDSLNHRIPFIELGTPLDDALRRDCTLNSLFYNINEETLEDFTGQGVSDLFEGVIRTPLTPPLRTFMDDPLRIFRLLRFKNKYNFRFADDLVACFTEETQTLNDNIVRKVSRERIAIEINKILSYNDVNVLMSFLADMRRFKLSRFLYSNNEETYSDKDLKQKPKQTKKTVSIDDIKVHEKTLQWLLEELPFEIDKFLSNPNLPLVGPELDKAILVHTVLLYPLYASGTDYSTMDVDFLLMSNNVPKTKIRKIMQIQETLCRDHLVFGEMTRVELGNFLRALAEMSNLNNYITILHLLDPDVHAALMSQIRVHQFDITNLDHLWGSVKYKHLLNGNDIRLRFDRKPGEWMNVVMNLQWDYMFEKKLDLETEEEKKQNAPAHREGFFVWLAETGVEF